MSGQAMMTPGETHTVSLDNLAQRPALVDGAIVQDENAPVARVGVHMWELRQWQHVHES